MKIVATIEGRLNSKRLPGKLIMPLGKSNILDFLIKRLKKVKSIDEIIVATTKKKIDDKLVDIAKKNKIKFYRGSNSNVLKRVYEAAKNLKAEAVVQVSGDSPLTDYEMIKKWIKIFKKKKPDILSEFWGNLPSGITAPIIKIDALKKSLDKNKNKKDLEHVTKFIFSNPKIFNVLFYKNKVGERYPELHLCVDELNDYNLVNHIVTNNKNNKLVCKDLIMYIKNNNHLLNINKKVFRKSNKEHQEYQKVNY